MEWFHFNDYHASMVSVHRRRLLLPVAFVVVIVDVIEEDEDQD